MSTRRVAGAEKDDLAQLVNKTFKLYRASPLYGFRLDRSKMVESLSRHLCVALNLKMNSEQGDQENAGSQYKGELVQVQCKWLSIAGWDPFNPQWKPVELTISISMGGKAGPSTHTAIMLPAVKAPQIPLPDTMASFPLVLMKMPSSVADQISLWLQKTYDCFSEPLHIPTQHLESMVDWYTATLSDMPVPEDERVQVEGARPFTHQHLELSYYIPGLEELSSITISVRTEQLLKIVGIVHASQMSVMHAIQEHIRATSRINVSSMVLMRVGTPIAYITNSGKLKLIPNASKADIRRWLDELVTVASETLIKK